jgi:hypothetical protein
MAQIVAHQRHQMNFQGSNQNSTHLARRDMMAGIVHQFDQHMLSVGMIAALWALSSDKSLGGSIVIGDLNPHSTSGPLS